MFHRIGAPHAMMETLNAKDIALNSKKHKQKEYKSHAERMRRNRINGCLEELKVAILGSSFQNIKMEQAEVLELTVQFVKHSAKRQRSESSNEGHVTKELDERCYTPCAYKKLHENKGKRLEISSDFTEYHNGEVVKKLRRKVKGKKLEFSPKPYERISPNSTGATVLNKSTSLRRPLVNLSNIKDSSKTHKSTENFWRPWR